MPGATRAHLVGRHGDAWKVAVTAPPERGAANAAVLQLLADTLAVPAAALALVSGHRSRDKIVQLAGIARAELDDRLAAAERRGRR